MNGTDQQRSKIGNTALPRIARMFGMPTDAFLQATILGQDVPACLTPTVQASALLGEFMRITDPNVRERCLDYVRKAAAREAGQDA